MLKDPNVERYVQNAIKPLQKQIAKLQSQVDKLSGIKPKQTKSPVKEVPLISKRTQQHLKKAMKLFPIGTKFTSAFGVDDIVTQPKQIPYGIKREMYWSNGHGCILVQGKNASRMVFDGKWWAKPYK